MADKSFLSWPFLGQQYVNLLEELESFAATHIEPFPLEIHDGEALDREATRLVSAMGEAGLLRYTVPGAYSQGEGAVKLPDGRLDVRALCLCRETLGRYSGLADFAFAMQGLGSAPISLFGSDAQKQRYLPDVAAGKRLAAFAISESNSGSDVAAMTTRAVRDGADYLISGAKTWISNAGLADQYVVFARTGSERGSSDICAFIVEADTPGLRVSERIPVIAPHPLGTLELSECRVPASAMIGSPGDGFKIAMATLDVFRSTVGAAALGFARRAMDEALARVQEREVFKKPLAAFQLTQAKIAEMAVDIDASALLIYRAAWTRDVLNQPVAREASMAKLYATEAAQRVIDHAVQLFGGRGVVVGETVEALYREIRALRIYEGTSEIQKLVIAGQLLNAR